MSIPVGSEQAAMQRALELAMRGLGHVEPNPMVGAVIVGTSGEIVAEGWHRYFGGPHAEIEALNAAGESARGATLYVTLEPCCHFGKTPPCSRAVVAAGIRRVVVATIDPAPHVAGGGIRELQSAGIDVQVGLLQPQAQSLIAPFVQLMTAGRPWFLAKWAMTLDGKIAARTGHSQWITNQNSRAIVHEIRGRMDGIVAGIGTVLVDDPQLNARPAGSRVATRIIVDAHARLPLHSKLVQSCLQTPVLVFVSPRAPAERLERLRQAGVDVVTVSEFEDQGLNLLELAHELGRRRMTNVMVEGGSKLLGSFHDHGLIDEVHAFVAPKLVGGAAGPSPLGGVGLDEIPGKSSLEEVSIQSVDGDVYIKGRVRRH